MRRLFSATILPLSTAYTVCEGLASELGWITNSASACVLLALHGAIVLGAGVILIPKPATVQNYSRVPGGECMVLPFVLNLHSLTD